MIASVVLFIMTSFTNDEEFKSKHMIKSVSWNWEKINDPFWMVPAQEMYFLLHRWNELDFKTILDLGCGVGRHSLLFAQRKFKVTALDLSESGLEKLSKSAREKQLSIKTVLADVASLPFKDASFDAVLAYHSIFHVDSEGMVSAINEVRRVLKPKGEVFLTLISKSTSSYTNSACKIIDSNVRMKKETEGDILPHYFCDQEDVYRLMEMFKIISLQHIEDIYDGKSDCHYYVHAFRKEETEAT
jgi:ubiquinone/menaquinone biosynthesis C-methylase UbiE